MNEEGEAGYFSVFPSRDNTYFCPLMRKMALTWHLWMQILWTFTYVQDTNKRAKDSSDIIIMILANFNRAHTVCQVLTYLVFVNFYKGKWYCYSSIKVRTQRG